MAKRNEYDSSCASTSEASSPVNAGVQFTLDLERALEKRSSQQAKREQTSVNLVSEQLVVVAG